MKKIFTFIFILYIGQSIYAQSILLEEDVRKYDIKKPRNGPNLRHFNHTYIEYGFVSSDSDGDGADIKYGLSHTFVFGYRYKLKLTNWLANGIDLNYTYLVYHLKQNNQKAIPNQTTHDKEKISFNSFSLEYYIRLNFGRRGNSIGQFMDFGYFASWSFYAKHTYEDDAPSNSPYLSDKIKVVNKGLNYYEPFGYGAKVRIGSNNYVLSASYRLSDIFTNQFKKDISTVELPRLVLGIQAGLF